MIQSSHPRSVPAALLLIALGMGLLLPCTCPAKPPNVVIILSDDQAWTDYAFLGHKTIETPRLDQLARESIVFTRGYVPTSLCRSSLMSLLCGQYPHQHLVTGNDPPKGTDRKEMLKHVRRAPMLSRILAEHGYACFQSGKWWEGNFAEGGFTAGMSHGDPARGGRHGDEGLKIGRQGLKPVFDFIDGCGEKPFFLWFAPMMPHQPHNPPERLLQKYLPKTDSIHVARYFAMCEWWDETCGQLLDHLEEKQLAENTLVVYLADNGWIQDPAAAKFAPRSKRSPHEGGIRTPIMLRWPAHIEPKRDEARLVSSIDLAPTILAACEIPIPKEMSGVDFLDAVNEKAPFHETVYGEIFDHDVADIDDPRPGLLHRWCVAGEWKLILPKDGKQPELYHLTADPHEAKNLASEEPERVAELSRLLDAWWTGK